MLDKNKMYRDLLFFAIVGGVAGYLFFIFSTKWYLLETEALIKNDATAMDGLNPVASLMGGSNSRRKMYDSIKILHSKYNIDKISADMLKHKTKYHQTLSYIGRNLCRLKGLSEETKVRSCIADYFERYLKSGVDFNANVVKLHLETPYPEEGQKILQNILIYWSRSNQEVAVNLKKNSLQTLRLGMKEAVNAQKYARERLEKFLHNNPKIASDKIIDNMFDRASEIDATIMELRAKEDSLATRFMELDEGDLKGGYSGDSLSPRRKQELRSVNEDLFSKKMEALPEIHTEKKRIASLLGKLKNRRTGIQSELSSLPPKIAEFYMLKFEFEASMKVLVSYKEGLFRLDLSLASSSSNIFVITPPQYKSNPNHPKLSACVIIGIIAIEILFIIFNYMYFGSKNYFSPGKIDKIRTIARLPKLKKLTHRRRYNHPWVEILEAKNLMIFNNVLPRFERSVKMLELIDEAPNRIINVTGIEAGVGKSFCSLGMAWACLFRPDAKVLLIDFDTRRAGPRFGQVNNMRIQKYKKSPLDGDLYNVKFPFISENSLDILVLPENFSGTHSVEDLLEFIENVQSRGIYNDIVIDTPPLRYFGDSYGLIRKSNYTILVSSANNTTVESMTQVLDELDILGVSHEKIFNIYNFDVAEFEFEKSYRYAQHRDIQANQFISKKKVG